MPQGPTAPAWPEKSPDGAAKETPAYRAAGSLARGTRGERWPARPAFPRGVQKDPGTGGAMLRGRDRERGVGPLGERQVLPLPPSSNICHVHIGPAASAEQRDRPTPNLRQVPAAQGAPTSRNGVPGPERQQRPPAAGTARDPAARPPGRGRAAPAVTPSSSPGGGLLNSRAGRRPGL
ncbi:collagen alpha-1(I) chain-like [Acanthaster planci]|uniref:Collagen alpha-1(I) chain-like n=1 Tax=Acanthaster planci TaxID=133434 RepID=A0A8B7ZNU3_ACAPL|nr:collagen alpha-1(I) chain-like [Acanthaster planci]